MDNKRNVLFLCESIEHLLFFSRMQSSFMKLNYRCIFITTDYGVYHEYKNSINNLILIKHRRYLCNSNNVTTSLELIDKSLSPLNCKKIYESIMCYCNEIHNKSAISLILGSQGIKVAEIAVRDFAELHNIKILFFELSNLPGKLFFDCKGSNALSYLYNHINILNSFKVSNKEYDQWRNKYIENNFKAHKVKQKVDIKKFKIRYGLYSRFGCFITGLKIKKFDLIKKIRSYILSRKLSIIYDKYNINKEKYYFFPMQVSSDSQIVLNSDIGLFEGLLIALNKAREDKLDLVVKLHPAEKNVFIIKKILMYREKYNFKIVKDNTFKVIKNAEKIITINSTIALESMILGKEVNILGRSYYKYFNDEYLKNYILGYLINIDYFSNEPITEKQILSLIQHYEKITSIEKIARGGSCE